MSKAPEHSREPQAARKRLPSSLKRFLVTGGLTVLLDAAVYALLLRLGMAVDWAKGIGLIAATIFAYVVNRLWAFNDHTESGHRLVPFLALYVAAIGLNIAVNRLSLEVIGITSFGLFASWFLATGASSTFNYVGLRFFVFRKKP